MHAGAENEAKQISRSIGSFYNGEIVMAEIGSVVATHSGSGAVGLALVKEKTVHGS